jgi:hypothetical protein
MDYKKIQLENIVRTMRFPFTIGPEWTWSTNSDRDKYIAKSLELSTAT